MQDAMDIYNKINLYGQENGMELTVIEPGHIEYRMTVKQKHLSSPVAAHGGAIAGLMDGVLGVAALSYSVTEQKLVSTAEFKINYFHPVPPGDELLGIGKIDFKGNRILASSGEIYSLTRDRLLVAKGLGTFNAYPFEKSKAAEVFQHLLDGKS